MITIDKEIQDVGDSVATNITYYGLSTDSKPTTGVGNGSYFIEMDTGKAYFFNAENSLWLEKAQGGGGSSTIGLDFIIWFPNSTVGWQVLGDFAAVKEKLTNGVPAFGIVYESFDPVSCTFTDLLFPDAITYNGMHSGPDQINIALNSLAGWDWTANGINWYNND